MRASATFIRSVVVIVVKKPGVESWLNLFLFLTELSPP